MPQDTFPTDDQDKADGASGSEHPKSDDATKTQDLAKAGREDFDPNAGQE